MTTFLLARTTYHDGRWHPLLDDVHPTTSPDLRDALQKLGAHKGAVYAVWETDNNITTPQAARNVATRTDPFQAVVLTEAGILAALSPGELHHTRQTHTTPTD